MRRGVWAVVAAGVLVAAVLLVVVLTRPASEDARPVRTDVAGVPVIAAAGDIACSPGDPLNAGGEGTEEACHQRATSDLLLDERVDRVLALGDLQYESGSLEAFRDSYDPTWGRVKAKTHPVVGNHEYGTPDAAGYFDYFGDGAGDRGEGWYSVDLGSWHVVALNSNCQELPAGTGRHGCAQGSPQNEWLEQDLEAHATDCTLAFFHHPRFSSGRHGGTAPVAAFWADLYDAGVEVVLNGHDHTYERFVPQDPDGRPDETRGIRQFVVGTGGAEFYPFADPALPTTEVRTDDAFGVLEMTLRDDGYDWEFVPEAGQTFTDTGSGTCH